jgi:predicted DCC family thiol-disulfide oxidoreductase YuxK
MIKFTLYYDGWCPFCRATQARIAKLDWLKRIAFVSIRAPGVAETLSVSPERLERRMHVQVQRTGKVVDGIDAVAAVAGQVPLLMPLWPFIRLASLIGVGQPLYDWIARQRSIIPVGSCDEESCDIHGGKHS